MSAWRFLCELKLIYFEEHISIILCIIILSAVKRDTTDIPEISATQFFFGYSKPIIHYMVVKKNQNSESLKILGGTHEYNVCLHHTKFRLINPEASQFFCIENPW